MATAMAGAWPEDRQPSPSNTPGLQLSFNSKNPFRNRATSPSPATVDPTPQARPFSGMSNNPFLDPAERGANNKSTAPVNSGNSGAMTEDVFKDLSLLDKPASNGAPTPRGPPGRSGSMANQHRPMGSDDRKPYRGPPRVGDSLSPPKRPDHRRRASESSTTMGPDRRDRRDRDPNERPPRTESEERRRRERRKEREERHRREKERIRSGGKGGKPRNLDIIDKLDVTGIYGQGLFHHDGPFDACNPHRNARKDRRAPMQAFPEGSANMALGGSGPLRSRIDLDKFHGRGEEGFSDYAVTRKADTAVVHPTDRTEPVHGEESYGLGTSTFLEGAPASKSALQRRQSEDQTTTQDPAMMGGGIQRKKSLAQRFRARGMSGSRRAGPGDLRSPEARYNGLDGEDDSPPRGQYTKAISAGGPSRTVYTKENEVNPFDEYDNAFEKKGAQIKISEQEHSNVGRARAPSSPKANGLVRSLTADSTAVRSSNDDDKPVGGGFLNRMKSLKGGRRTRPERKDSNAGAGT